MKEEPLLALLVLGLAVAYSTLSVLNHLHLGTSAFDLALFDQVVWHYSRFETPESTIRGFDNILGDHFHPVLVLLAPLYWLWSDASMLLLGQAMLLAASAFPVFLFCRSRIGRPGSYMLTAAYGLFWGIQYALVTDFHEVAFAPLLIASAIYLADVRRWRACLVVVVLLLLVKENFGVFVAFFGVYLILLRHLRQGLLVAAAGTGWFYLTSQIVIPALSNQDFGYWRYDRLGETLPDALWNIARAPWLLLQVLFESSDKVQTLIYLTVPFLGLILFSPLLILAVPLVAERLLSSDPDWWTPDKHYWVSIAPVLAMGAADGLRNLAALFKSANVTRIGAVAGALMLIASFVTPDGSRLAKLTSPSFYTWSDKERAAERAFAVVPEHSGSVAAESSLLPHLSQRADAWALSADMPATDYVVYSSAAAAEVHDSMAVRENRYQTLFSEGGITVLRRRDPPPDRGDPSAQRGATEDSSDRDGGLPRQLASLR